MKKLVPVKSLITRACVGWLVLFSLFGQTFAQQTAADTQIQNQASATYSDGNGNNFSAVSNTVTITVAKVAGLAITPDGQTNSSVVPGQSNVTFTFRVTNTGNFTDQARFLANGGSIRVVGPAVATAATISGSGANILTNSADVLQSLTQNGFVDVVVTATINSNATPGSGVQIFLGDATTGTNFDNVAANNSANEVRTVSTGAVNGSREARGDISVTVDNDGLLRAVMSVPPGPVALGSNIQYTVSACNDGQRALNPLSGDSSIYMFIPVPLGATLTTGQTYPAGTQFTTSPLSALPTAASWSGTAPGTLSSVTRIRIPLAASLASGACGSTYTFQVTVTTNNTNTPIYAIADAFAVNQINAPVTDQTGDSNTNRGDGNANFDEPLQGQPATPNQGIQQPTTLLQVGNVLIGPLNAPNANGPTGTNDDYTNRSVNTGIAGVAPGGVTTAAGVFVFINTVQNTGNADDTYTLSAPTVPAGFTVEISTNGGGAYTTVSGGGTTTIAIPFNTGRDVQVRVTAPAGQTVLTGFPTVVRAVSGITAANSNNTIDRLYTGYVRLVKAFTVNNTTGVGAATDPVPGADITYTITYDNVSSSGGAGNSTLNANTLVITENGNTAPNNWATYTDHVVGATDSGGGTIAGDTVGSAVLTDTIAALAPGQSGTFTFTRRIR